MNQRGGGSKRGRGGGADRDPNLRRAGGQAGGSQKP